MRCGDRDEMKRKSRNVIDGNRPRPVGLGNPDGFMLVTLLAAMAWSGIAPADRTVWIVESVWSAGVLAILLATRRWFRFSSVAYLCFWIWALLQTVGAHYTFEHVPMDWLMSPLGLTRNPYDRLAHFVVGFFAFPFAEFFDRRGWARSARCAAFFAALATIAMAGLWEIVEWLYAAIDGGEAGAAFLGSQGDVWDAQKDILCDSLGATCAALAYAIRRSRRANPA